MNFDKVYNEHYKGILNYFSFKTQDFEVAQELTNDVFMRVAKHQDSYDLEISAINTWIFTIAKRILIDYYRVKKNSTISLSQNDDAEISGNDFILSHAKVSPSTPHMDMVSKETMLNIQTAIVKLPKKYRRVCNLFFNHNYKLKEIASMTKKPLNTVKGNIHKAREILQKQLS